MVRQKNPLRHRVIREIFGDLGKYATIFIMMVAMIGLASGYLIAVDSMQKGYAEGFSLYNIEDGNFTVANKLTDDQIDEIEKSGNTIYPIFFKDVEMEDHHTLRMMVERKNVNQIILDEGKMPTRMNEVAIDRNFADNNQLKIGDHLSSNQYDYEIVGLVSFSDYSAMFSSNKDSMFDAILFSVAVVSEESYEAEKAKEIYRYAWQYESKAKDEAEEKKWADEFVSTVRKNSELEEYVPQYLNQAIFFAGDDLQSDSSMIHLFLYIMLLIMAFVTSLTTADTIVKEAGVIGTLRASGYTKWELFIHYLSPLLLVIFVACIVGNLLGYTYLKDVMRNLYYNSYSFPNYPTLINMEAFLETTIAPVIIMIVVSVIVLMRKLSISPLQFLRHDLSRKKNHFAMKLAHSISFFFRYRLRVIFQNIPHYFMLFIGLLLANILLLFGLSLPYTIDHYEETIAEDLLATKQYILSIPANINLEAESMEEKMALMEFMQGIETETEGAEKFTLYQLKTHNAVKEENVLVYGVQEESEYIDQKIPYGKIYVSTACANKFRAEVGNEIELKEQYEDKVYTFKIDGIYPYNSSVAIFMNQEYANEVFDLGEEYFSAYFSDEEIKDIDEQYIASEIDAESLTKVTRQLNVSFGGFMRALRIATFVIFFTMMYLLTKIIIEKNSQSISMVKILGYTTQDIQKLYLRATSIVTIVEMLICLPIANSVNRWMIEDYMSARMTGYLPYHAPSNLFVRMFLTGMIAYIVVAILEMVKIYRIPKTDALKNVE
ncbi:MAG: ABC transporter permease [Solobacterium sp.]|nr:ABC transporter permease [Solobacterium sp.]